MWVEGHGFVLQRQCRWFADDLHYSERLLTRVGNELKDAAWYYPEPKEKAKNIKDYVAFCKLEMG